MGLTYAEIGYLMVILVVYAVPLGILMTVSAVHHTRRWLSKSGAPREANP
jgi:hypothetical protein